MNLKSQILTGWTWRRALFLVLGIVYFVSFAMDKMWLGTIFSSLILYQAILGKGCAGGHCATGNCEYPNNE